MTRRAFLRTASSGLAIIGGCGRPPSEKILPYHQVPPELTPGIPLHYATSLQRFGYATGVIVRSREGRPVKIEGNPEHPASLGAAGVLEQAQIYELYDPRRAREIQHSGQPTARTELIQSLTASRRGGEGLRLLLEPTTSPLRASQLAQLVRAVPEARITFWSPAHPGFDVASRTLFGRPLAVHYDFSRASRVLCLDADIVGPQPFHLRYARDLASRRRVVDATVTMSRIYTVGPKPTCTSAFSDRNVPCRGDQVGAFAAAVLGALAADPSLGPTAGIDLLGAEAGLPEPLRDLAAEVAADLAQHRGESVVVASARQPWPVHALAHVLNSMLGAIGETVWWTEPVTVSAGPSEQSLEDLVAEMHAGSVDTLLVAGVDPVYAAPPGLGFAEGLKSVRTSVACALFEDATSRACAWTVPAAHDLERWGDGRAYDGTLSFVQPLIEPLWNGRSIDEVLGWWSEGPPRTAYELLHAHYAREWGEQWRERLERALSRGLVPATGAQRVNASLQPGRAAEALASTSRGSVDRGLEIGWHVDAPVVGGGGAWNPWLQELPDPITKLTWGNAVLVGPQTAARLGVESGELVEIAVGDQTVEGPVLVVLGHVEDAISLQLGYGQERPLLTDFQFGGPWAPPAEQIGFDAARLRDSEANWYRSGARIRSTGRTTELAITQNHMDQYDRELAVVHTLPELQVRGPELLAHLRGPTHHLALLDQRATSPQWGMVVDLTLCNGCSSCVIACQAENNIPTVGKEGVRRGREMHWLRIDRYQRDDEGEVESVVQPMLCQHCEYAPCEYVCPTNATVHSPDGLNEMIYNRCVGTRFCSNNCPYYVRRFNWFDYGVEDARYLQKNPEVTVRERGVMEKCTYCVQRIRTAGIQAELQGRPLVDGDVVTACQEACPTRAIVFGDITDPQSEVSRWRARPQQYSVLHELGTSPRTVYLAKIRNVDSEEA